MQAHYDMQWPDDGLHMTNGSALAAGSTWELEPDSEPDFELASSDMRSIKSSSASQKLASAELCPPPTFNENESEAPDTSPRWESTPALGCAALTKRAKVRGKHSTALVRKQWTPEEEALFLKALAAFAVEIETKSDPATGRVSVRLGQGVSEMISMIVSSRSVSQVRSHTQKHYIRKAREAARVSAAAATTSESENVCKPLRSRT